MKTPGLFPMVGRCIKPGPVPGPIRDHQRLRGRTMADDAIHDSAPGTLVRRDKTKLIMTPNPLIHHRGVSRNGSLESDLTLRASLAPLAAPSPRPSPLLTPRLRYPYYGSLGGGGSKGGLRWRYARYGSAIHGSASTRYRQPSATVGSSAAVLAHETIGPCVIRSALPWWWGPACIRSSLM